MKLFLNQTNTRKMPPDYSGRILLCDIDKTYLATSFSSWRGLIRIPFEFAIDKQPIPGAVPLLRALRRGTAEESALIPLYFVSGSPVQLRGVIERRMTLDGIEFDGITFKDQLGLVLTGRPADVKRQVGYKLTALLSYWRELPKGARWLMFGDDAEMDAEVFMLFGKVCAGLRGRELERELGRHKVASADLRYLRQLTEQLEVADNPVERVFIHLERGSDPSRWSDPIVVATASYLQSALVLFQMGCIRERAVGAVSKDLRKRGVPEVDIHHQLEDVAQRFDIPQEMLDLAAP